LLYNQKNAWIQTFNKGVDETKDLIKGSDTECKECKDRALRVEDDLNKIYGDVGKLKGRVDTVVYILTKAATNKQGGGGGEGAE
jgi:hypothetical protein